MSGRLILDSCSLIALFRAEPGWEQVRDVLSEARDTGAHHALCVVNWGEVSYVFQREEGTAGATDVVALMEQMPIAIVDVGKEITTRAAAIKATYPLAYADAFCAALAEVLGWPVLTKDPEFAPLERDGVIEVCWLT